MASHFLVSTDTTGILGSSLDWETLWGDILYDKNCKGFEMIGWKWSRKLISGLNKHKVVGIHGRTGGLREGGISVGSIPLGLLNLLFLENKELISLSHELEYILLHRSCLNTETVELLLKHKKDIGTLFIENDISPNALAKTIDAVEDLRKQGLNVGITLDLVHFLREPHEDKPNLKRWDLLLEVLSTFENVKYPMNCHFPIGSYKNDSLPVLRFTPQMWRQLSRALNNLPIKYIVLENQANRKYSLFLPKGERTRLNRRTKKIFLKLKKYKII